MIFPDVWPVLSIPTPTSIFGFPALISYILPFSFIPEELNLMNGPEYAGAASSTAIEASKALITLPTNRFLTK